MHGTMWNFVYHRVRCMELHISPGVSCMKSCDTVFKQQNACDFYIATMFLVGAFSLKEKSPTITVNSFFFRFQLTISL